MEGHSAAMTDMSEPDFTTLIPELCDWNDGAGIDAENWIAGDYELRNRLIERVAPVDSATAKHIAQNVAAYGDQLAPLNDATWDRAVCRWMDDYWQVLVDLTTEVEPVSDLTLHARHYEGEEGCLIVESVHVR